MRMKLKSLHVGLLLAVVSAGASAMTLAELLNAAVGSHPAVRSAALEVNAASEDVEAARRQQWPTVSAVAEAASGDAVASRTLRLEQTLWDFGRTRAGVGAAERGVAVAQAALTLQGQTLGLQVIDNWQKLLAARGRAQAARSMLKRLAEHQEMMARRVKAEVSTQVDLDLVQSRILQGQVELAQAESAEQLAVARLQDLTGLRTLAADLAVAPLHLDLEHVDAATEALKQSDWDAVAGRQPAVVRAAESARQAQERIRAKSAESYPQLYARIDQSLKDRTHGVFLGVRYTPGAGFSSYAEAQALSTRAAALDHAADAARLDARQALTADLSELADSRRRAGSAQAAASSARRVLESYERQFPSGRKTWIDVMNAVREVAQNEYALVDASVALQGAAYRLQLRADPGQIDRSALPTIAN